MVEHVRTEGKMEGRVGAGGGQTRGACGWAMGQVTRCMLEVGQACDEVRRGGT